MCCTALCSSASSTGSRPPHAFGFRITEFSFLGRTRLSAFFDPGRVRCVVESLDFCTGLCHKGPDLWHKECACCATCVSNVFCLPSLVSQNGSSGSFQRQNSEQAGERGFLKVGDLTPSSSKIYTNRLILAHRERRRRKVPTHVPFARERKETNRGRREDPVGGMQDGGRGLLKEDNISKK